MNERVDVARPMGARQGASRSTRSRSILKIGQARHRSPCFNSFSEGKRRIVQPVYGLGNIEGPEAGRRRIDTAALDGYEVLFGANGIGDDTGGFQRRAGPSASRVEDAAFGSLRSLERQRHDIVDIDEIDGVSPAVLNDQGTSPSKRSHEGGHHPGVVHSRTVNEARRSTVTGMALALPKASRQISAASLLAR